MNPIVKYVLSTVAVIAIVGGIAAPKVLPLLKSSEKELTAQKAGKQDKGADKTTGEGRKGNKSDGAAAPLKVSTFVVKPAPFAETVNSTGSLRADEGVELQAETNGKIVAINFTEGAQVHKGDLLLKLNDADIRAYLTTATYRKQLAQSQEKRYAQLLAQKVVTQNDYDTALSDMNVQQSQIELYKAQIEKTEIRAPFDGVVGLRYVSMGAYVNASTRIATLQRIDKLKIDFSVPEKYSGRILVGAPIHFSVAGGERKFDGQIYAIDPRIDSGTRTITIRAVCPNKEGHLLPGAFANVEVTLTELPNALLIPSEAVIPGLDEKNVFLMNGGKAERRAVETGTRTATTVHVLSGLKSGDVIITSGLQSLRAGQAVVSLDAHSGDSKPDGSEHKKRPDALAGGEGPSAGTGKSSQVINTVSRS